MSKHKISGQLEGEYRISLASWGDGKSNAFLWAVLLVDEDNSHSTRFRVGVNGETKEFGGSLAQAIRYYEDQ